jgi:GAF domain-containing protein
MFDPGLKRITQRLTKALDRDILIQNTANELRNNLHVNRVVLYYFYRHWQGQVIYEAISSQQFSILGSMGPDDCFNGEYAKLYEEGRLRAINDINTEAITPCHRDFLQDLRVRANLAAPILNSKGLWGLLIAHHCQSSKSWTDLDIEKIKKSAAILEKAPAIQNS